MGVDGDRAEAVFVGVLRDWELKARYVRALMVYSV
jgi:hypothetical protein